MTSSTPYPDTSGQFARAYDRRTPTDYLDQIRPEIRDSLTDQQAMEFQRVLALAMPKPAPKLVDLRFEIDLIFNRFFIVLFVGQDRRHRSRRYPVSSLTRFGNAVAAVVLLVGFNLAISAGLLMGAYLLKSAVGIDLFPGHLVDRLK